VTAQDDIAGIIAKIPHPLAGALRHLLTRDETRRIAANIAKDCRSCCNATARDGRGRRFSVAIGE
jgi:hypothetical protein